MIFISCSEFIVYLYWQHAIKDKPVLRDISIMQAIVLIALVNIFFFVCCAPIAHAFYTMWNSWSFYLPIENAISHLCLFFADELCHSFAPIMIPRCKTTKWRNENSIRSTPHFTKPFISQMAPENIELFFQLFFIFKCQHSTTIWEFENKRQ